MPASGAIRSRMRGGALAFSALFLGWIGTAHAQAPKLQAIGETSVGVSDNVQSAPEPPLPGGASKTAGAFVVLRPGLVLGLLTPRTVQRLAYTFDYDVYFARSATNSASNRLE